VTQTDGAISIDGRNNVIAHKKKIKRKKKELKNQENPEIKQTALGIVSGRVVAYKKILSVHEEVTWRRVASQ
jgi:predicted phage-related endonuclease